MGGAQQGELITKFGENGRLLVFAEDPGLLASVTDQLSGLGYSWDAVKSKSEAEERLIAVPYDLVIAVIGSASSPDGLAFLAKIKADYPEIGVIVVADRCDCYLLEAMGDKGACDCLDLPLCHNELAGKISRVLRERKLIHAHHDELQTQTVLNGLLLLSMEECSFQEMLQRFLVLITSFPRLGLRPQGAVLLVDEHDPKNLILSAHHNLAPQLLKTCANVPFGRCLCGRAAASGELLFVRHVDEQHENRFDGMLEHGHYCVPIKAADGTLLGVFTLYLPANFHKNLATEETLRAVAAALAGIIRYQRMIRRVTESEARYHAITDAAMDGIIMMDQQGRINFFNPGAERLFGCLGKEAVGYHLQDLIVLASHTKDDQLSLESFFEFNSTQVVGGKTIKALGRHRQGHEVPLELSLSSLQYNDAWQTVAIVRDISERKRHEEEKDQLNRKLQHAYKMEAIGTLAGGIAHDFNNLLSAILGFSELAMEEVADRSQAREDLEKVITAANRARDLTRQILAFSRQSEKEKTPMKIQLILKEAMKLLRSSIPSNIDIIMNIDQDCPTVLADPGQLHQIIMNLCTNAYYAMKQTGGTLSVELRFLRLTPEEAKSIVGLSSGEYVLLIVADSGPGIQPEIIHKIFDPFFTTKPQGEGTGMGLAIIHGIISELGGAIQVHSQLGQGAEFKVLFPVVKGCDFSLKQLGPCFGAHGAEQILVVDDESSLLEVSARNLTKLGYVITARTSSVEALAAFRAMPNKFDLVLTDQAMPNMTGLDMAREILKIRTLPIILMTGFADVGTPELAKNAGISEVLIKPVALEDLNRSILRHLRSKRREAAASKSIYK